MDFKNIQELNRHESISKMDKVQQAKIISEHYLKCVNISKDLSELLKLMEKCPENVEIESVVLSMANMLKLSHSNDFGIPLEWKSEITD